MEAGWSDSRVFGHICKRNKDEVSAASNVLDERYRCGGCSQELRTICQLHEHLLKEFMLGSYLYDHCTKTAYPKQASVSIETQTDDQNDLKIDDRRNDLCEDTQIVHKELDTGENSDKEDETGRNKMKRKRKYVKRREEKDFEMVPKKKSKSKSSKILKTEILEDTVKQDHKDSELLETTKDSLETSSKQEYMHNMKEEILDDNYDGSTDDNLDNVLEIEKVVVEPSEKAGPIKKTKKKNKKKSKARTTKTSKVKNYKAGEVLDKTVLNNEEKETNDVKFQNNKYPKYELDEDNRPTKSRSASDVKRRGRPRIKAESLTCEHCDSVFYTEKQYNVHLHGVHKTSYPFSCKQCNFKPFVNKEDYMDHKNQHPKQSYHCELCGKELKSREGLRLHELIHSGEKPYCCGQCEYRGRTSTQLRQHMYTHMDSKTEQCEHCGKAFFTKGKLKEHLRYCRKEFNHHCPHCQKGFPTASGLRKHILMHTGERAFICDVCGFATFRITLLNSHMRTHTGEKPHKCKECGAQLATRGTLLLHLRTHTHEKPFVCSYCSKAFTSKWNLQTHLRQHTGETPYKCDICGQGFKQNVLRKSHMRSHLESTSTEPNILTHSDSAPKIQVTADTDINEHSIHNHMDATETPEPANVCERRLEPDKLHVNSFVYDRSDSGDILNQALQSENIYPLDLKLQYTTASDLKNAYSNSVINSQQLQASSFELINYQDIKHV
ncbi:zinc finger protein 37-like [Mercenaria mercenaria]|uniref:zinc finger protein 37-like n=1 Tax=Mercenaria mercenaria TaxID=6596 RepID=UPI00234E8A86|nr:zinc finger protein 37-like [Mercenaria mercenaria]XP_045209676.2 zinc finger protein 37-like [Mercenaria mercenaria]